MDEHTQGLICSGDKRYSAHVQSSASQTEQEYKSKTMGFVLGGDGAGGGSFRSLSQINFAA